MDAINADELISMGTEAEERGDIQNAIKYYQAAANAGSTDGLASIGLLYLYGTGVKESVDDALAWFQKVIDAGDMDGWWLKGNAYKEVGDYNSAVKCYEIAAEKANNCRYVAVYELAQAYHYGEGKKKNNMYPQATPFPPFDGVGVLPPLHFFSRVRPEKGLSTQKNNTFFF